MKRKLLRVIPILAVLAVATFVLLWTKTPLIGRKATSGKLAEKSTQSSAAKRPAAGRSPIVKPGQRVKTWDVWIEKQADIQTEELLSEIKRRMPFAYEEAKTQETHLRAQVIESLQLMALALQETSSEPPPLQVYPTETLPQVENGEDLGPKKHHGPQTVEAIMETFQGMMSPNAEVDEKYPEDEWIQMLLNRGISIKDTRDYFGYQAARRNLPSLEKAYNQGASGEFGTPPTDDWHTYKADYINRQIWEYEQKRAAGEADPTVTGGLFVGPNKETFLPLGNGRVYVRRSRGGAVFQGAPLSDEQRFNILFKGEHPEGYSIIYLDENDTILNEPPPTITREELTVPENWEQQLPENELPEQGQTAIPNAYPLERTDETRPDSSRRDVDAAEPAPNVFEKAQEHLNEISTMSAEEVDTMLEKELARESSMNSHVASEFWEQLNPKEFSRARIMAAKETLSRYGTKEGLRRLRTYDPTLARRIEREHRQPERGETRDRRNSGAEAQWEDTR